MALDGTIFDRGSVQMAILVVTFDGDQTLWDFRKAMHSALVETLALLKGRVAKARDLTVEDLVRMRDKVAEEVAGPHELIRKIAFGRTLEQLNVDDPGLAQELYELYMDRRFELIEPYSDALETLRLLSARYKIGLVSNGNTYPERCGFDGYFDFTVFAHEVGARKPDRKIFEVAAARGGCRLSDLVHVGDQLGTDVVGAKGVGAEAVWLNREGLPISGDVMPDVEIRYLSELVPILLAG